VWDRQQEADKSEDVMDQNQSVGWAMDVCTYWPSDDLTVRPAHTHLRAHTAPDRPLLLHFSALTP
jgi:hypothetical protein